jgi:hypothetical protein
MQEVLKGSPAAPGRNKTNGVITGVSLGVSGSLNWRAPRSFNAWAVDNLWISVEFGEFEARAE